MSAPNATHKPLESGLASIRSPQLSSEGLSSPPRSSPEAAASPLAPLVNGITSMPSSNINPSAYTVQALSAPIAKPSRRKATRKPKDPASSATGTEAPKVKRIRKPRDPNTPPVQRRKKNPVPAPAIQSEIHSPPLDPKVIGSNSTLPPPTEPVLTSQLPPAQILSSQTGETIQSFFNSAPQLPQPIPAPIQSQAPTIRTSGQNYDPIRSSNYDPVRETVVNHSSHPKPHDSPAQLHSLKYINASTLASNAIVHHGPSPTPPLVTTPSFTNQDQSRFHKPEVTSLPVSPTRISQSASSSSDAPGVSKQPPIAPPKKNTDQIVPITGPSTLSKKSIMITVGASNPPKQAKAKDAKETSEITYPVPPPLPGTGNGPNDGTEYRAPTVILNISMNGEVNKYVNFTRLAEQQYGWDALHPRLAAQRDRLARVAAAGAALERNGSSKDSGDEMSLDSEAEGSNGEILGVSDGRLGAYDTKKVPKKRKMREDEYDKDDGFVDDTELLWEEQAAASNDGFFVYSGPLIPEGEKTASDTRADGATKRGRGRGSRGGASRASNARGATATAATAVPPPATAPTAAGASSTNRNNLTVTGLGSRGGSGSRKPRITKADRVRMEQEKIEREKAGLAALPAGPNSSTPLTIMPSVGNAV